MNLGWDLDGFLTRPDLPTLIPPLGGGEIGVSREAGGVADLELGLFMMGLDGGCWVYMERRDQVSLRGQRINLRLGISTYIDGRR